MRRERTADTPDAAAGQRRKPGAIGRRLRRVARALVSSRVALCALRSAIVVELCVLGVGVVKHLEVAAESVIEASRIEMMALESEERMGKNPSGTALSGTAHDDALPTGEPDETPDAPPALRPRDAATIIFALTGDMDTVEGLMGISGDASGEGAVAADDAEVDAEDEDEADALIRQGVAAMIAGDMRQCIVSLEQAATVAPNHPAMLYYYGLAYDKLLNPRKALDYYNRLFQMRDKAGKYFDRAARRLSYGPEGPAELRGKLAFGPIREQRSYDITEGDRVSILLPVLLAPGESVRANEINVRIDCFEIVNGRKIDFSREKPVASWVNEVQTWENWEEDIEVSYVPPSSDEVSSPDEVRYYGFTAKLFYNGEPMDCVSTPSSLILHEQMLNSRRRGWGASGLLPDDGLDPYAEEAVPYSQGYDEIDTLP